MKNSLEKEMRKVGLLIVAEISITIIATLAVIAVSIKLNNEALGYASFILIGTLAAEVIPLLALLTILENEEDEKKE